MADESLLLTTFSNHHDVFDTQTLSYSTAATLNYISITGCSTLQLPPPACPCINRQSSPLLRQSLRSETPRTTIYGRTLSILWRFHSCNDGLVDARLLDTVNDFLLAEGFWRSSGKGSISISTINVLGLTFMDMVWHDCNLRHVLHKAESNERL